MCVYACVSQRLARKTLSLLLDLNDFPACIVTAIRADAVRQVFLPAVGAGDQGGWGDGVVCTTAIPTPFGVLSLGKRRHQVLLAGFIIAPAAWAGAHIIAGALGESRRAVLHLRPTMGVHRGIILFRYDAPRQPADRHEGFCPEADQDSGRALPGFSCRAGIGLRCRDG
jgi:hypothetical protein